MKAVMMSIQPKWCELIANGKKTVEVRKTRPKLETPFKCYIYATNPKSKNDLGLCLDKGMFGNLKEVGLLYKCNYETAKMMNMQILSGKVIGEFMCDKIYDITPNFDVPTFPNQYIFEGAQEKDSSCLSFEEINSYLKGNQGYGLHISDLVIYDEPKELSGFIRFCPEWKKEEITEKCIACTHFYRTYEECIPACDCEGEIHLTKAPQSWCYVEELSGA